MNHHKILLLRGRFLKLEAAPEQQINMGGPRSTGKTWMVKFTSFRSLKSFKIACIVGLLPRNPPKLEFEFWPNYPSDGVYFINVCWNLWSSSHPAGGWLLRASEALMNFIEDWSFHRWLMISYWLQSIVNNHPVVQVHWSLLFTLVLWWCLIDSSSIFGMIIQFVEQFVNYIHSYTVIPRIIQELLGGDGSTTNQFISFCNCARRRPTAGGLVWCQLRAWPSAP